MFSKDKLKKVFLLGSSFLILFAYQNCSPSKQQASSSTSSSSAQLDASISKAMAVLTTKCSSCHDSVIKAGGVDVLNINELLARGVVVPNEPSLSLLFTQIQGGQMPPGKALALSDIQAISDWIQTGFTAGTTVIPLPPPVSVPLAANFNSININILKPRCLGCHNSNNSSGGISFSTYIATMNVVVKTSPATSSLYTSTAVRNTMPKGGALLNAAETKVISDWILAGAANN